MIQEGTAACRPAEVVRDFHSPIDMASGAVGLALTRDSMRPWLRSVGMGDPDLHQLLIAVGEACSNVVEHSGADRSGEHPPAWVEANCDGGRVRITVTDRGRWKESDPVPNGKRGRGWLMMKNLVDQAYIHRGANGTTVELVKELTRPSTEVDREYQPTASTPPPGARSRVNERLRIDHGARGEVVLTGEIDEGTAHRLHAALQLAGAAGPILVVDLYAVHHLQSAGISVFFQHARSNLRLRVRADSGVATVIRICGLSEIVPVDFVATKG